MTAVDGAPMHDNGQPAAEASTLRAVNPAELLRSPEDVSSPALQVVLERAAAGSRPGARTDDHVVCLAIEGGGLRGSVTAGMCVVLEAAGLVRCFDRVYGVSAGALSAAALAAGQAALNATRFQDAATRQVISRIRPLAGRAMVDFDFLFGELIAGRKPLTLPAPGSAPEVRLLATSLDALALRVLTDFADAAELHQAIRASAAMPLVAGPPASFRGERMADGALLEPIPYQSALGDGATHVLVLRSRPPRFRNPPYLQLAERLAMRRHPKVSDVLRDRPDTYNRQADELERLTQLSESPVTQIAVPDHARVIGRFDPNPSRVVDSLRLGATALASAVLDEPIELCWQPVAYQCAPRAQRPAAQESARSEHGADIRAALRHRAALLRRVGAPATPISSPDP